MLNVNDFTVGILAGGKATRMNNQDKGLIEINGQPLIENLLRKINKHTSNIVINANRNISLYEKYNFPVVCDKLDNYQGPLSGIYSMLGFISTDFLITLPCDCPNFKWVVINTMIDKANIKTDEIYIAHNNIRSQSVFMLIPKAKINSLHQYLSNGDRKIDVWYKNNKHKYVYFDKTVNYFENINTIEQLNEYNKE